MLRRLTAALSTLLLLQFTLPGTAEMCMRHGAADPAMAEKERAFVQVLEAVRRGSIPFLAADCYLPFGKAWNQASNYADGRSSAGWARKTFPEARFAGTIEVAYADALGVEVNADSARALGRDLARAIWRHLGN